MSKTVVIMPGLEVNARKLAFDNLQVRKISTSERLRVRIIHVSHVESCSSARRNVRTKPEANKIADYSEKSAIFSHSRLQSSY